jgi:hypothetical protein
MLFNATFNNISVIAWGSVLLVEKTTDLLQVTDKLYCIMLNQVHLAEPGNKEIKKSSNKETMVNFEPANADTSRHLYASDGIFQQDVDIFRKIF